MSDEEYTKLQYQHVILCFLCLTIAYVQRVNISIAIVAMTDKSGNNNIEDTADQNTFDWTEQQKSAILSSFFWGYLWTQVAAGNIAESYGPKSVMTLSIIISSILSFLTPWISKFDYKWLCLLRAGQGLAQSSLYPCATVMISRWIPAERRTRLLAFVYSGRYFGTMICMLSSGFLASFSGWPSIFYVTGGVGFIWWIFWNRHVRDNPKDYVSVPQTSSSNTCQNNRLNLKTPWIKIITSMPVWAIAISQFGCEWGFWTMLTQLPSYMTKVNKTEIKMNGLLSSLPYLFGLISVSIFARIDVILRDQSQWNSTKRRTLWNTVAMWGGGGMLLFLATQSAITEFQTILFTTFFMFLIGAGYSGHFSAHADLSTNFCGTIMGLTNSIANVASALGPLSVGWIVSDSTSAVQWKSVFLLTGVLMILCNIFYMIYSSSDRQSWNEPESHYQVAYKLLPNLKFSSPSDDRMRLI